MDAKKRSILLVDDERGITNALGRELGDWAAERSLEIVAAISARKGLEFLEERGEDTVIVVSDLKMPEMKGSDFLLEVKKRYPDIISILLTGYSETQEVIKAVQAGIFSFILKPWDSEYLVAELQKAYEFGETRRRNAFYLKTIEEELRWAGEFQKAILKPNLPSSAGVEFRVSYRPVPGIYCGGDYYDIILLGQDRYLLLVGDVAGHGAKAAFVTGILKAVIYSEYVRAAAGKNFSPGAFLGWLNERMNFEFRSASNLIITFFAGVLDLTTATFRYANAGHDHPFNIRMGKAVELPVSGSAIGFANSIHYTEQTVDVSGGDVLVIFTDGLVEIGCSEGCAPLKLGPILERIEYGAEHHRRLFEAALGESGSPGFTDDVTIVTARIL
ncbi:MAG: SpoIIE family protein phosphatase [Spirochaetes bacterium]|nr:SpoIIE family protein phosphatase [Spirochaetota bacterium]